MDRSQLIEQIHDLVPTADRQFLARFTDRELNEYLEAVVSKLNKRTPAVAAAGL
jgi:hypothetical protein